MKKFPKLTKKQLAFAHARISGKNQTDSLREAIPNNRLSPPALRVEASRLDNHPKVREYIEDAIADSRKDVLLSRDKKRMILGNIAQDRHEKGQTRIAAIHQDNLMTGDHKPVRIEGEITLHAIFTTLTNSTGLPSADEVKQLKQAEPAAPAVTVGPLTTAMERAG